MFLRQGVWGFAPRSFSVVGPHRLTVRTEPSQGSNRGPIPREVICLKLKIR